MLRGFGTGLGVLALAGQALVIALVAYNLITSLWGLGDAKGTRPGRRRRRFRVVVPAHNEAKVIGRLLEDLAGQDYPRGQFRVAVLADRCIDDTVAVATPLAEVYERHDGLDGKGALLAWYAAGHPLDDDECLVILDADNRVPSDLLTRFADEMDTGHDVVQAYIDTANPDEGWLATASALSYWASNRMVQLARRNLGWSADLGGTGMAMTPRALAASGGFGYSMTEDIEKAARLAIRGYPVWWMHNTRVYDEKPTRLATSLRQRARWSGGRRGVAREYASQLLATAWRERRWGYADLVIRMVQPSRSFTVVVMIALAIAAAIAPRWWLIAWWAWVALAALQVLLPMVFLAKEGIAARYVWRYPLLAIWALLWLPVQVISRLQRGWYHTPHVGTGDQSVGS